MGSENVYIRARRVVREVAPLLQAVRRHDKGLADQLKRAAQSVVLRGLIKIVGGQGEEERAFGWSAGFE